VASRDQKPVCFVQLQFNSIRQSIRRLQKVPSVVGDRQCSHAAIEGDGACFNGIWIGNFASQPLNSPPRSA
jgi:hypothetical protein